MSLQIGGGSCSLCGSPNTTKVTCPLNPDAKNPKPQKHPLAVTKKKIVISPAQQNQPELLHITTSDQHLMRSMMNILFVLLKKLCIGSIREHFAEIVMDPSCLEGMYIAYDNNNGKLTIDNLLKLVKQLPRSYIEQNRKYRSMESELLKLIKGFILYKDYNKCTVKSDDPEGDIPYELGYFYNEQLNNSYQIDLVCGSGFGATMMKKVEDLAKSNNKDGIHLDASSAGLIKYYNKLGYSLGNTCNDVQSEELTKLVTDISKIGLKRKDLDSLESAYRRNEQNSPLMIKWKKVFDVNKFFDLIKPYKSIDGGYYMYKCLN